MKAAVLNRYNKNGCDLEIKEIPVPEYSENEVLVRIRTAGVNPLDNMIVHGEVKLIVPYAFPLVMGNEFAGIIEKTGSAVKGFNTGDRELAKEFSILKTGGSLVSLRGLPNGEFAKRSDMSFVKRMMFKMAGGKYDKMAAAKGQKYFFIFVHEDGTGLERVSEIFRDKQIEASVDEIFTLEEVNKAMKKVASGGSKGKTILKMT